MAVDGTSVFMDHGSSRFRPTRGRLVYDCWSCNSLSCGGVLPGSLPRPHVFADTTACQRLVYRCWSRNSCPIGIHNLGPALHGDALEDSQKSVGDIVETGDSVVEIVDFCILFQIHIFFFERGWELPKVICDEQGVTKALLAGSCTFTAQPIIVFNKVPLTCYRVWPFCLITSIVNFTVP